MAASQSSLGMQHLTVVPTNFEPDVDEVDDDEATTDDGEMDAADESDAETDADADASVDRR